MNRVELMNRRDEIKVAIAEIDLQLGFRKPTEKLSKEDYAAYKSWHHRALTKRAYLLRERAQIDVFLRAIPLADHDDVSEMSQAVISELGIEGDSARCGAVMRAVGRVLNSWSEEDAQAEAS